MAFQYPWGNLQGLNLTWFVNQFKKLREDWATAEAGIDGALDAEIQKAEDALSDVFDARDAAAASATAAAGSATSATTAANFAGNSASVAAASASAAQTAATNAAASEAAAAQSASQAALSASNAGNSATQAGNSATAAATSETNAAASAQEAEDVLDSIPADYSTLSNDVTALKASVTVLEPPATSDDIGKALIAKTVANGKVTAYEFGEAGGGAPAIINTIDNVPVASFDDGTENPVKKLMVGITPNQSGSGTPTPVNVRPITGWPGANINVSGADISSPNIYAIAFPSEAGTVYGGILTINEDGSGDLVVNMAKVDLSALTWNIYTAISDNSVFYAYLPNILKPNPDNVTVPNAICDRYKAIAVPSVTTWNTNDYSFGYLTQPDRLAIRDTSMIGKTGAEFKDAMSNVDFVGELATPTTYQLAAQLVIMLLDGTNNVWSNAGNIIQLQYYANSKGYIDEQTALIKAIIAPVLEDMIADTALTANDFRIVNNTLYRISAPIASGATLTPGTNCEATTVATVLKTLLT